MHASTNTAIIIYHFVETALKRSLRLLIMILPMRFIVDLVKLVSGDTYAVL
jgi:hypothetical protein